MGRVSMRMVLTVSACLHNVGESRERERWHTRDDRWQTGTRAWHKDSSVSWNKSLSIASNVCNRPGLYLRGGGRGHPKATAEEYHDMDGVELTDQQALDLRRHWKRKPEWLQVKKAGTTKLIKTKTILNVMKDRDRLEQKRRKSLPLHLVDLGLAGIAWVRGVIGWDKPGKFHHLLRDRPAALPAETQVTLQRLQSALQLEDGYAIAREVKPRIVKQLTIADNGSHGNPSPFNLVEGAGKDWSKPVARSDKAENGNDKSKSEKGLVVGAGPAEALSHVGSHTYGEISADGFAQVLAIAAPQPGEVFVDLGSGTGKAVLVAAALYPFSKVIGIEFVAPLHEASVRLMAHFREKIAQELELYAGTRRPPETEMLLGDVTSIDWGLLAQNTSSSPCVVFAACTCWSQEQIDDLIAKAGKLSKGTRLITMTRNLKLEPRLWRKVSKSMAHYGRGRMTFFIHEKIA